MTKSGDETKLISRQDEGDDRNKKELPSPGYCLHIMMWSRCLQPRFMTI